MGVTTKVHMLYENSHFLKRDFEDFSDMFEKASVSDKISLNIGLYIDAKPGDAIIIDEADRPLFK